MKPASLATVLLRLASLWLIYQTLSGSLAPLILNRMAVQQRFAEVPFLEGVQPMFVTLVLVSLLLAVLLYVWSEPLGTLIGRGLE